MYLYLLKKKITLVVEGDEKIKRREIITIDAKKREALSLSLFLLQLNSIV